MIYGFGIRRTGPCRQHTGTRASNLPILFVSVIQIPKLSTNNQYQISKIQSLIGSAFKGSIKVSKAIEPRIEATIFCISRINKHPLEIGI
jgi:hypothetical protein